MGHDPVLARNMHALFKGAKKPILQNMATVRDMPNFDIIARLFGLERIFYSHEFEAFKAQVLALHKEY